MLNSRFSFKGERIARVFVALFRGSCPQGLRNREEARAREIAQTKERLEREEKAALEQAARLAKELKGREWVWGPNGEVRTAYAATVAGAMWILSGKKRASFVSI